MEIRLAETDAEIERCFPAISVLRPHLRHEEFVSRVHTQQQQGYRLLYLGDLSQVPSVAGFRILEYLAWGKVLYIDDLSTIPDERGRGHGRQLLEWLIEWGKSQACDEIHLDTGYQRHNAHRLYLRKGFELNCHHLSMCIK
jgi:GNAT superfamily N-acetyltransferase